MPEIYVNNPRNCRTIKKPLKIAEIRTSNIREFRFERVRKTDSKLT